MGSGGLNALDRAVAWFAPVRAVRRASARYALAQYEAATPGKQKQGRRSRGGPDTAVLRAGHSLREQARHLDENHDLAKGILDVLVQNVVGPQGIGIEPQPRRNDGTVHEELAGRILDLQRDWSRRPEVTWQHDWPATQRLAARTWFRDGEVLSQIVAGTVQRLDHGTRIPLSLELLEPDLMPLEYHDPSGGIVAGIQQNEWGRPTRYHLYKHHPADGRLLARGQELKSVPADRMLHLKTTHRIRQARGVSIFASVLMRLDDVKDYEESERVAAKVAASMAAYIKKGTPEEYSKADNDGERELKFRAGLIFDDLAPGEDVGTIDTKRPNSNLEHHRRGQLRAIAAGTGVTYSSAAKDYDGTYSAQRQELVEGYGAYGVLASQFIGQFVRPTYERMLAAAVASGELRLPSDVDRSTLDDALFIPPQMPWIDPDKESKGYERLENNLHASGPEIVRKRGQNPRDVAQQEAWWQRLLRREELRGSAGESDDDGDDDGEDEEGTRSRGVRRRA